MWFNVNFSNGGGRSMAPVTPCAYIAACARTHTRTHQTAHASCWGSGNCQKVSEGRDWHEKQGERRKWEASFTLLKEQPLSPPKKRDRHSKHLPGKGEEKEDKKRGLPSSIMLAEEGAPLEKLLDLKVPWKGIPEAKLHRDTPH